MNNNKGFSVNSMIVGLILCFGLFIAVIGGTIDRLGPSYDIAGYNSTELGGYDHLSSLESRIKTNATLIESASVDKGAFDWFAGLWGKIRAPFVFVTKSYTALIDVTEQSTNKLKLMPEFKTAITTIIVLLVVFGLLAARYYMGRK